jgi:hypothetical protein
MSAFETEIASVTNIEWRGRVIDACDSAHMALFRMAA